MEMIVWEYADYREKIEDSVEKDPTFKECV